MIACIKIEPDNDLHDFFCCCHRNRPLISTLLFPWDAQSAASSYISFVILHKRSNFYYRYLLQRSRATIRGWLVIRGQSGALRSSSLSSSHSSICAQKAQHSQPNLYTHACWLAGGVVSALSFYPALSLYLISPSAFLLLASGSTFGLDTFRYLVRYTNLCNLVCFPGNCPEFFFLVSCYALRSLRLRLLKHLLVFLVWNICNMAGEIGG